MKLAFVLFHYFPYGGLERDMLAIARACADHGHQVSIYTQSWDGDKPGAIPVVELPVKAWTNHGRAKAFVKKFQQQMQQQSVDLIIGFNKMPGLDIYYAADVCFAQKAYEERNWLYRLGSRCRTYLALEKSVFGRREKTILLMISRAQIALFQKYYQTPSERFKLLPPGIRRNRIMPDDYAQRRLDLRQGYGLKDDNLLLLMVGSDFQRKGVERAIRALAMLPEPQACLIQLWVAGQGNPEPFIRLANELGVGEQVKMLGARDDVSELFWSADIFLHPAYSENTGTVLLEAMVAGLPVIATDVCGYAHYILEEDMGKILGKADVVPRLADAIKEVASMDAQQWRERGRVFSRREEIFSMIDRVAEIIEQVDSVDSEKSILAIRSN